MRADDGPMQEETARVAGPITCVGSCSDCLYLNRAWVDQRLTAAAPAGWVGARVALPYCRVW
jgi:hypothetical protein